MQLVNDSLLELAPAFEPSALRAQAEYVLTITMVYQDLATREWAADVQDLVAQSVGEGSTRAASWRISDLARPSVLAEAIRSAARADVVVVAVSAAEELPRELYAWIEAWLPRRVGGKGALVALIGLPEAASQRAARVQDYFQAVAREAWLGFFPQQRLLPAASRDPFDREATAERTDARTAAPAEPGPAHSAALPKPEFEFAMPNGRKTTNRLVAGPRNGPANEAARL